MLNIYVGYNLKLLLLNFAEVWSDGFTIKILL